MGNIIEIASLDAPELEPYVRLTEAQLRSRQTPAKGIFIAESGKVILHALDAGYEPVSLLMGRRHVAGQGAAVIERCGGIPVYTGEDGLLERLTGYRLTRGVLCAMRRPAPESAESVCAGKRRIAVLEGLIDPTNVGAVFRSAAALGMEAVLVTPDCCDPLHRRAVRVSMGTVFQLPWACTGPWPEAGLALLRGMGFKTAAMALSTDAVSIDDAALMAEKRLAVVLGTEGDGLADGTVARCDYRVRIPMENGVDSLNVAAAGAVAFWQLRVR